MPPAPPSRSEAGRARSTSAGSTRACTSRSTTSMYITHGRPRPAPRSCTRSPIPSTESREYGAKDPEGHFWHFGTVLCPESAGHLRRSSSPAHRSLTRGRPGQNVPVDAERQRLSVRSQRRDLRPSPAGLPAVGDRLAARRRAAARPGRRRRHREAHERAACRRVRGRRRRAVPQMRDAFAETATGAEVLDGSAEALPVPDGSFDAVAVGQAYHWFDTSRALAEIARVLGPAGVLADAWNRRDVSEPWVAELTRILVGPDGRRGDPETDRAIVSFWSALYTARADHRSRTSSRSTWRACWASSLPARIPSCCRRTSAPPCTARSTSSAAACGSDARRASPDAVSDDVRARAVPVGPGAGSSTREGVRPPGRESPQQLRLLACAEVGAARAEWLGGPGSAQALLRPERRRVRALPARVPAGGDRVAPRPFAAPCPRRRGRHRKADAGAARGRPRGRRRRAGCRDAGGVRVEAPGGRGARRLGRGAAASGRLGRRRRRGAGLPLVRPRPRAARDRARASAGRHLRRPRQPEGRVRSLGRRARRRAPRRGRHGLLARGRLARKLRPALRARGASRVPARARDRRGRTRRARRLALLRAHAASRRARGAASAGRGAREAGGGAKRGRASSRFPTSPSATAVGLMRPRPP